MSEAINLLTRYLQLIGLSNYMFSEVSLSKSSEASINISVEDKVLLTVELRPEIKVYSSLMSLQFCMPEEDIAKLSLLNDIKVEDTMALSYL